MVVAPRCPAQLADPLYRFAGALAQVILLRGEKLERLLLVAFITFDRPAQHHLPAQIRASGGGGPLPSRVDQITHLAHHQRQRQILAALDRADEGVTRLNAAALAGDLVQPAGQRAAFDQGMGGVERSAPEVVFSHGSSVFRMPHDNTGAGRHITELTDGLSRRRLVI